MNLIKPSQCENCRRDFLLSGEEARRVSAMLAKQMAFIMVECPLCRLGTQYCPTGSTINASKGEEPAPYRCPVSHCAGWVSFINDAPAGFWGCGECGSFWRDSNNFQRELKQIAAKYRYRAMCYRPGKDNWTPAPFSEEVPDYERLVEDEPIDPQTEFMRG
jgi:hypothetical protein